MGIAFEEKNIYVLPGCISHKNLFGDPHQWRAEGMYSEGKTGAIVSSLEKMSNLKKAYYEGYTLFINKDSEVCIKNNNNEIISFT